MAIAELLSVVAPPSQPVENGPHERWPVIERAVGTLLPTDLRDYGLAYGSGWLVNLRLYILNPFAIDAPCALASYQDCMRYVRRVEGVDYKHPIFPEPGGLLCWGSDAQSAHMCWLTVGPPDKWPVLIWDCYDSTFTRFDMPLTSFVAKIITRQISVPSIWPADLLDTLDCSVFTPDAPAQPGTIHELYLGNLKTANFWTKDTALIDAPIFMYIKQVAGKESGKLTQENSNIQVVADFYEDGLLVEENRKFNSADAGRNYFFCPPEWAHLPKVDWPTRERRARMS